MQASRGQFILIGGTQLDKQMQILHLKRGNLEFKRVSTKELMH